MEKIKKFFKYLNDNPRMKALFKLGIWVLFFAIVFAVVSILGALMPKKNNTSNTKIDCVKKLIELKECNYEYEYTITKPDSKIIYKGSNYQGIEQGYKETDKIIKYQVEDNMSYQIIGDYFEPIESIYDDVDVSLISLSSIAELIKAYNATIVDNSCVYNFFDKAITITINKDSAIININMEQDKYLLNYTNINHTNEIKRITSE